MRPTPPPEPLHWQVWALYALSLLLAGMVVYGLVSGETPGRHPFTLVEDPEKFWQSLTLLFVLACAAFAGARWLNRR
ncbi:MAG: hypothetical protein C0453_04845 [Comamonadaceae bacterium]|nr:hypothetical protein [Comamonadaceae bacterium]